MARRSGRPIHVLHVDDEPAFTAVAAEFLQRLDRQVVVDTESNVIDGLARVRANDIDCVVSDFDMPEQTGIEFLEAVREGHPDLPFVLFTGKGSEEVASEAISKGVTDYLQKETGTSQYEILFNRIENAVAQYRTQIEARETEQRLQTIAENTTDILWKFSADWDELLFINSAYEEIWGQPISDLRADPQSFLEGIHPDDRERAVDAMAAVSAGESVEIEFRVNEARGFDRWVWARGRPVVDDAGEVRKVVGFARDITDRKAREQRLERQNAQLDEFTSIISHDLRNPVTVAAGRIELARQAHDSEDLRAAAQALERMEELIDDVLELAKVGAASTDTRSVRIAEVIDGNWRETEPGTATTVVTMERAIQADESQLDQLLENLIRNAVEHGSPDVTVTIGELPDGFYVEDDGPGIPAGERENIFETGYSTKSEGTGFGLNVVQQIVEAHGWEIAVTEQADGGARFEVTGVRMG